MSISFTRWIRGSTKRFYFFKKILEENVEEVSIQHLSWADVYFSIIFLCFLLFVFISYTLAVWTMCAHSQAFSENIKSLNLQRLCHIWLVLLCLKSGKIFFDFRFTILYYRPLLCYFYSVPDLQKLEVKTLSLKNLFKANATFTFTFISCGCYS